MIDGSRWRRWSPWVLRAELRALRSALAELAMCFDSDTHNTEATRNIAQADAILAGHRDPAAYALRRRVEGDTLVIDATRHGHRYTRVRDGDADGQVG